MYKFEIHHELTAEGNAQTVNEDNIPICFVGRGSYSGEICLNSFLDKNENTHLLYIGRYTSLGGNIDIYADSDHDYRSVFVGCIPEYGDKDADNPRLKRGQATGHFVRKGMTVIGDDVWLGNDVTIISSVVIGSGAIVAAHSVVTKDIPPYTIWAGNPARQVGERFTKDIADKLMEISWWDFDRKRLKEIEEDMRGEVDAFADKYWMQAHERCEEIRRGKHYEPGISCNMAAFVESGADLPVFCDIVEGFYNRFRGTDKMLSLYYHKEIRQEQENAASVAPVIDELKGDCNIRLCEISMAEDENAIAGSDYFILGRDAGNIERIGYALKYGVKILSGVDKPMFRKM